MRLALLSEGKVGTLVKNYFDFSTCDSMSEVLDLMIFWWEKAKANDIAD